MRPYFTRERFGRPQFLAGLLLLCFLAQALWLVHAEMHTLGQPDSAEAVRIAEGWKQWHGRGIAAAPLWDPALTGRDPLSSDDRGFDPEHSPLLYLASAAPLLLWPRDFGSDSAVYWRWLPRIPFLACGVFLGASLWYVARRLCGNTGGFVALTFYCFSPSLIQASAVWHTEPEIVVAWGAFGDHLHGHRGGAHALRAARGGAVELAAHRAAGNFAGDCGGLAVLAAGRWRRWLWVSCCMLLRCEGRQDLSFGLRLAWWDLCFCSRCTSFAGMHSRRACGTPRSGERPGVDSQFSECTNRSRCRLDEPALRLPWRFRLRW